MSSSSNNEPSEALRLAFLKLLTDTLLHIRTEPDNAKLCLAFSDHMHNVPSLLAEFDAARLAYYWEIERECFIRALKRIDRMPPVSFETSWQLIEAEYLKLISPHMND